MKMTDTQRSVLRKQVGWAIDEGFVTSDWLFLFDDFVEIEKMLARSEKGLALLQTTIAAERQCSQSLRAELARKDEALEEYASAANWSDLPVVGQQKIDVWQCSANGYDLARSVLSAQTVASIDDVPPIPDHELDFYFVED